MCLVTYNPSKIIRQALINIIKADSYFIDLLKEHDGQPNEYTKIYEAPLETLTINKFPAVSIYDTNDIEYVYDSYAIRCSEIFYIDIANQKYEWKDARDSITELSNSIEALIGRNLNLSIVGLPYTIEFIRRKGIKTYENTSLWTFIGQLQIRIKYSKRYYYNY